MSEQLAAAGVSGHRDDRTTAAFHEAGHAVAHVLLRVPLLEASILPEGNNLGHVRAKTLAPSVRKAVESGSDALWFRDRMEREAMTLLAGEAAQEIATDTTDGSALVIDHPKHGDVIIDGDWHSVVRVLSYIAADDEIDPYSQLLRLRVRRLLSPLHAWTYVELVAEALLARGRLTGREIRDLRHAVRGRIEEDPAQAQRLARVMGIIAAGKIGATGARTS